MFRASRKVSARLGHRLGPSKSTAYNWDGPSVSAEKKNSTVDGWVEGRLAGYGLVCLVC
jgi:hypothetical protein